MSFSNFLLECFARGRDPINERSYYIGQIISFIEKSDSSNIVCEVRGKFGGYPEG